MDKAARSLSVSCLASPSSPIGAFVVPRRLELAARWAWVSGQSGNINGDGTFSTVVVPGVGPVQVVTNAFRRFEEANEYAEVLTVICAVL